MSRRTVMPARRLAAAVGRNALLGVALLLLGACAGPRTRSADSALLADQAKREAQLAARPEWALRGRVAVSDGRNGGSGSLDWQQKGSSTWFELRAPVSRQSWQLEVDAHGARLAGLEGGPRSASKAETLLRRELGWELPLADLAAWVRGARAPGRAAIEFAPDGLPAQILQRGWRIEYRDWDRAQSPPLPKRVFAERGPHRVRLVVAAWLGRP